LLPAPRPFPTRRSSDLVAAFGPEGLLCRFEAEDRWGFLPAGVRHGHGSRFGSLNGAVSHGSLPWQGAWGRWSADRPRGGWDRALDRKSTRLNSSHVSIA